MQALSEPAVYVEGKSGMRQRGDSSFVEGHGKLGQTIKVIKRKFKG